MAGGRCPAVCYVPSYLKNACEKLTSNFHSKLRYSKISGFDRDIVIVHSYTTTALYYSMLYISVIFFYEIMNKHGSKNPNRASKIRAIADAPTVRERNMNFMNDAHL